MAKKDLVIGVDASTTACKVVVWNLHGRMVAQGRQDIPLLRPHADWHEQRAGDWWQAFCNAVRIAVNTLQTQYLAAICICPQRETFVPVDESGSPLRNAILWMDGRARSWMPDLVSQIGESRFHAITGKPPSGNLTGLKIKWLREVEPEIFQRTRTFLDVAAYLHYQLTGKFVTAWGIADPTGMFDMNENSWSPDVLAYLGVDSGQMPVTFPGGSFLGTVSTAAAAKSGLPVGLPVIAGVGDGQASGLAVDISHPGDCYLSLGTSVVSGTYTQDYLIGRAFRTMYAGFPGAFSLETVILGGTYTLDWFLANFSSGKSILDFDIEAQHLPPGSDGLVLLPYWNSVLNPYWDPTASGLVLGWRGHHGPIHFYRAILEGIAFELRVHFDGVESALHQAIERLMLMGGGAKSDLWCQLIANVTGKTLQRARVGESTALGAGILAAYGAGLFASVPLAASSMGAQEFDLFIPDQGNSQAYQALYNQVYRHLFPVLQPYMQRLIELSSDS